MTSPFPLFPRVLLGVLAAVGPAAGPVAAQYAPGQPSRDYGVHHWGIEDGLPGHSISHIDQSADGHLWMVSGTQLVRFDGVHFDRFDVRAGPDGPPESVASVAVGRADTIWVVTQSGLLLSLVDGRFEEAGPAYRATGSVAQAEGGDLWGVTGDEVWLRRDGRVRVVGKHAAVPLVLGGVLVKPHLWSDRSGAFWIVDGASDLLHRFDATGARDSVPVSHRVIVTWPSRGLVLFPRRLGDFVEVATAEGAVVARHPAGGGRIPRLVDRNGLLWVSRPGALEAYGGDGSTPRAVLRLEENGPGAIFEDVEGSLWLTMPTTGLYRVKAQPFRTLGAAAGIPPALVQGVGRGAGGTVLAVDGDRRLLRITDGKARPVEGVPPLLAVGSTAHEDERGALWLALWGDTGSIVVRRPDGTRSSAPTAPMRVIRAGREPGEVWIAGDGVHRVRDTGGELELHGPWLERQRIHDVLPTDDGGAWLAGRGGVWRLSPDTVIAYLPADGHPTSHARALFIDPAGDLWIGRYFGGLVRFDGRQFRELRERDGLFEDVVSSIVPDGHGNLWMAGNRSIHRVSLADLEDWAEGTRHQVRGYGYGSAAGLANAEGSGWHGYAAPDGRLWFPTFGGAAVVDPGYALSLMGGPPHTRIRAVRAGGRPLELGAEVRPERGQRDLEVEYVGISLRDPGAVRYQVMMEGVDEAWVEVGKQTVIRYAGLPPGRRAFRVRSMSEAETWSAPAVMTFDLEPFFYETAWFPLLAALALLLLAVAGSQWRTAQLRTRQIALQRLVEERTRELAGEQARAAEALALVSRQAHELRSVAELRSRLVANVSHELRTPLTLIIAPLHDLMEGRVGALSDRARDHVRLVLASARRLHRLVDQLLDVARLQAGAARPGRNPYESVAFLESLAAAFRPLADHRGIALDVRLPAGPVPVRMEPDALEKVFSNLLGNALKFTREGGRVALTARVEPGPDGAAGSAEEPAAESSAELVVSIEDDGLGIPQDQIGRIFDRFHQVDDSPRRAHQGAGLGLALVRELVELHGGRVEVESEVGRGSRFTVRLPVDTEAGRPALPPAVEVVEAVEVEAVAPASEPAVVAPASADAPTILLVEDDVDLRAFTRSHLTDQYRVVEASDGVTGLEAARRLVPDLIISDVMMPGLDGQALCEAVKSDPEIAFVPVILLTARATQQSRLAGLEGGADDYLVKPFDARELRLRVRNIFALRRRLRERLLEEGRELTLIVAMGTVAGAGTGADTDADADADADAVDADAVFLADLRRAVAEGLSDEDFSVEDLAAAVAVSRSTLYRKVEALLGKSPMDVLWGARLENARGWLRRTDVSVSEVAYAAGFKSVPHFTRRFRERFGQTPAAFQRGAAAVAVPADSAVSGGDGTERQEG